MVDARTVTALAGLLVGLAVSGLAWVFFDTLLVLLFLPFVPGFFWRLGELTPAGPEPRARECPVCEFSSRHPDFEYCPRDGRRLKPRS